MNKLERNLLTEMINKYPFIVQVLSEGKGAPPVQNYAYETIESAMKGAQEHRERRFVKFVHLSVRLDSWDCQPTSPIYYKK